MSETDLNPDELLDLRIDGFMDLRIYAILDGLCNSMQNERYDHAI